MIPPSVVRQITTSTYSMAHLDDQAVRALQAVEQEKPPEDCEGVYDIDWVGIFESGDGDE